jgi:hypothetical protein
MQHINNIKAKKNNCDLNGAFTNSLICRNFFKTEPARSREMLKTGVITELQMTAEIAGTNC